MTLAVGIGGNIPEILKSTPRRRNEYNSLPKCDFVKPRTSKLYRSAIIHPPVNGGFWLSE